MNSFMSTHEELKDLVIFDLETYDTIDHFSAEHITDFCLNTRHLWIVSSQRGKCVYLKDKVGFCFRGR